MVEGGRGQCFPLVLSHYRLGMGWIFLGDIKSSERNMRGSLPLCRDMPSVCFLIAASDEVLTT